MTLISACQDQQAGISAIKCLSQGHNRMVQMVLNQEHVDHKHGTLTTRPCCLLFLYCCIGLYSAFFKWSQVSSISLLMLYDKYSKSHAISVFKNALVFLYDCNNLFVGNTYNLKKNLLANFSFP